MAERYALEMRHVRFSYDRARPFIEDFSVGFDSGSVTGIVGPNGCGKSTLLKLAAGMMPPREGEVLLKGVPVSSYDSKSRARRLAFLSQGHRPRAMTVESLVACGRFSHKGGRAALSVADREAVERAMDRAGVSGLRGRDLTRLSGGQRQRAFIAMVLAQDADVILLDEPTTYLDIGACHDVMRLTRLLNREERKAVVVVVHDLDLALRYCDRLVVMDAGRLVFSGSTRQALASKVLDEAFDIAVREHIDEGRRSFSVFPRT